MTEAERAELWQRAHETLERSGEALRQSYERNPERVAGRQMADSAPAYSGVAEPVPPIRRPPREGRDWTAEQRWVEQIIDQKLGMYSGAIGAAAGKCAKELKIEIIDAMGEVIAAERKRYRAELDALRTELLDKARDREIDSLQKIAARFEQLLMMMDRTGARPDEAEDEAEAPARTH